MIAYLSACLALCGAAMVLVLRDPAAYAITGRAYRASLLVPWKLATFLAAAAGLVVIAPYTGDPTWDYVDAIFMSVLTFATAPWAVGTLYHGLRGWVRRRCVFVAACAWLFSASWSYDAYLLWRDGHYTDMWAVNLAASSVLYACAGLLWNLEQVPGRGVIFGFMERDWPRPAGKASWQVALTGLPFMLIVAMGVLWFFLP